MNKHTHDNLTAATEIITHASDIACMDNYTQRQSFGHLAQGEETPEIWQLNKN